MTLTADYDHYGTRTIDAEGVRRRRQSRIALLAFTQLNMNPYAPPEANVEDVALVRPKVEAPALWNPNAAANWSLLFTPAFGAWLHMKNWQALGNEKKAKSAHVWVCVSVLFLVLMSIADVAAVSSGDASPARIFAFPLLIGWYFASGRGQAKFVKKHYGDNYPRKGWLKPFGGVLLGMVGLFAFGFVFAMIMAIR